MTSTNSLDGGGMAVQVSGVEDSPGVWKAIQLQWRRLALVLGVVFTMGAIILLIYFTTDVNVRIILDDPAETSFLPEYAGLYSSIGVLTLWTTSIVGFVSTRFGRFSTLDHRRLLVTFAAIVGFLALDDLLMWHEWGGLILARMSGAEDIASTRSALEAIIFAIYLLVILVWAWKFRVMIWRSPWPLLALGGFGFAASIGLDLAPYLLTALKDQPMRIETTLAVAEDLLKLLGIGGLAAYGFALAIDPMREASSESRGSAAQ